MTLQYGLFDSQPHDNRTRSQKQRQRAAGQPKAKFMFSAAEMAKPSWQTRQHADGPLLMEREDPRTPEEIESDRLQAANDLTTDLWDALT